MRIASPVLTLVALAGVAGCGADGLPGSLDFAVAADQAASAADLTVPLDLSLVDLTPARDFGGVICGAMTCQQGMVCCIGLVNNFPTQMCATSCDGDAGSVIKACDGPEDCMGKHCCVQGSFANNMISTSGAMCTDPCAPRVDFQNFSFRSRLCHSNRDCDPSSPLFGAQCCSILGLSEHFCAAPVTLMGISIQCP